MQLHDEIPQETRRLLANLTGLRDRPSAPTGPTRPSGPMGRELPPQPAADPTSPGHAAGPATADHATGPATSGQPTGQTAAGHPAATVSRAHDGVAWTGRSPYTAVRAAWPRWVSALALVGAVAAGAGGAAAWLHRSQAAQVTAAGASRAAAAPALPVAAAQTGPVLEASGFVVANRQATVSASVTGRIVRLLVAEGRTVRRGQVLAELDAGASVAQVAFAEAGVQAAENAAAVTAAKIRNAERSQSRSEDLAQRGFISEASLDQAVEAAALLRAQLQADRSQVEVARRQLAIQRDQLRNANVEAPFDGVVTELSAHVGEIVSPISGGGGFTRTGICTVVDPLSLQGEVDLNEQYLSRLHHGQRVKVRFPAYPELSLEGRIATLPTAVDRNTAAVRVRIAFDAPPRQLTPGLRADFAFMAPGG